MKLTSTVSLIGVLVQKSQCSCAVAKSVGNSLGGFHRGKGAVRSRHLRRTGKNGNVKDGFQAVGGRRAWN